MASASALFLYLNDVNLLLSRYELPIVLLFGNLGNFANVAIFSRRALRSNTCSMYFICLSIVHLILLNFHGLPRVIAFTTGSDVTRHVSALCKIRSYLFTLAIILSRHFVCLISIDRWLASSLNISVRQLSTVRSAHCLKILSITFWAVFSIHALVGFDKTLWGCSLWPGTVYALFYSLYGIVTSFLTLIIMTTFSALTLLNIRRSKGRTMQTQNNAAIAPMGRKASTSVQQQQGQRWKRDMQLVRVSIFQVVMFIILNFIWTAYPLANFIAERSGYYTFGGDLYAVIIFLGNLGMNLMYVYAALTFILYTLASSTFRREFYSMGRHCFNALRQRF